MRSVMPIHRAIELLLLRHPQNKNDNFYYIVVLVELKQEVYIFENLQSREKNSFLQVIKGG